MNPEEKKPLMSNVSSNEVFDDEISKLEGELKASEASEEASFKKFKWDRYSISGILRSLPLLGDLVKTFTGDKEALNQRDYEVNKDKTMQLREALRELYAKRAEYRANRASKLEAPSLEMEALKKIGITNPYFYLRNFQGGEAISSNLKGQVRGYRKIKDKNQKESNSLSDLFKILMIFKMII